MKIGQGVSEQWRVENRPLPLTWLMAYTTACTTVQAVIIKLLPTRLNQISHFKAKMYVRLSVQMEFDIIRMTDRFRLIITHSHGSARVF